MRSVSLRGGAERRQHLLAVHSTQSPAAKPLLIDVSETNIAKGDGVGCSVCYRLRGLNPRSSGCNVTWFASELGHWSNPGVISLRQEWLISGAGLVAFALLLG
jgi:hypothetical protein